MRENMVRTQVYLPRKIHEQLQARAEKQGLTLAVQIREALADYIERVAAEADDGILHADDPIFKMIGMFDSGLGDLSINHDHYLYGAPRREDAIPTARRAVKEKRSSRYASSASKKTTKRKSK
ncbi:MAG TPA: ribbon-helix-helix domain-containing protein [Anaerolineae bacterium]|nr:ribbon-helix-helix domain-containing protein [Anaerolineae bacterium]